jgi:hypothetical protein
MTREWTTPADVVKRAAATWARGQALAAIAARTDLTPLRVSIHGPAAGERGAHYDELRRWLETWQKVPTYIRVEWREVNDRIVGRLRVPVTAHLDTVDELARAAGRTAELAWFREAMTLTPPAFHAFMAARPHRVIAAAADWPSIVAAADWLAANPDSGIHPRQIPADGVHSKIVERYRRDIADMLPDPAVTSSGRDWFESRFGLATKPLRVRIRVLDRSIPGAPSFEDMEVPVAEAAALTIEPAKLVVVENEVPFLSLPTIPQTVAVLGNGNAAAALIGALPWARAAELSYWGDIDTWGLVILDRLRAALGKHGKVSSLLMDRATLLKYRDAWVVEETQSVSDVHWLTEPERALYGELVENRHGHQIRLEQERIPIASVVAALGA